jgi:hypothetical protein
METLKYRVSLVADQLSSDSQQGSFSVPSCSEWLWDPPILSSMYLDAFTANKGDQAIKQMAHVFVLLRLRMCGTLLPCLLCVLKADVL